MKQATVLLTANTANQKMRLRSRIYGAAFALVLLCALCGGVAAWHGAGADVSVQTRLSIKNTVLRAAVQCCAIEGVYPPSLEYLIANYGLQINQDAYIVTYEVFASNVLPQVDVLSK